MGTSWIHRKGGNLRKGRGEGGYDSPYQLLKESCFPDCLKVSLVVPVFKNVGERSTAKNYCPVSFLSVVGKVFA